MIAKECLYCKEPFEAKKDTAKYCSASCRVMYCRKNKKPDAVSPLQVQVLYNEMLDMVSRIKLMPPQKVYDAPKLPSNFSEDEPLSFDKLKQGAVFKAPPVNPVALMAKLFEEKRELSCAEEYQDWLQKIENSGLTSKQIQILKTTNQ